MSQVNSPYHSNVNPEVQCIQEALAQFYSFFGNMQHLKAEIDMLDLDDVSRNRIMYQLDCIEREYKESQEWFMPREVQDVRVGVVGTEFSLKTAVVSLFVEGLLDIDGDEKDGRSKSKIMVDNHCKLLLIREETGSPSRQLSQWADVLLLVFSYADIDSLNQVAEFYQAFRRVRQETPVMLVGIKDDQLVRRYVKEESVKEMIKQLDYCQSMDVLLTQQSTYILFTQACKVAMSRVVSVASQYLSPMASCPLPSSTSQISISSSGAPASSVSSTHKFASAGSSGNSSPFSSSPSHTTTKRGSKRKSMFGGGRQGAYNVPKTATNNAPPAESYGSGRPVPIKEGHLNKKSGGSLRNEWKKKYLVLTQSDITYYPNLQDYMTMTHGKSFKLQHITVKVPGQRVSAISSSRTTTTTPPNNLGGSDLTESLTIDSPTLANAVAVESDRSNSQSPILNPLTSSLDVSYNSTTSGLSSIRIMGPDSQGSQYGSSEFQNQRYYRSPVSPGVDEFGSSDHFDELPTYGGPRSIRYEGAVNGGRGHTRNGSLDDNTMLKQLRSGGISYSMDEQERSATMSRIETKKSKEKKSYLSALPASSEELLEGSQESLGRLDKADKKRKDKERSSVYIDRSNSETSKDKAAFYDKKYGKNHKRQRSWAGNKLLDVEGGGAPVGGESSCESCEFHILTSDNKTWSFEAASPEEAAQWVKAINLQIKKTFSEFTSHKGLNSCNDHEKKEIYNIDGNGFCVDCNSPNPDWCSLNHGCLLCIECSGVHRNLGSHISRIRSLTLDDWSPELIAVMLQVGNKVSRDLWEAKKPRSRPIYSASREDREKFIKAKYVDKEFLQELPKSEKPVSLQLMEAVRGNNTHQTLLVLAHSAPEDINHLHIPENQGPLHLACHRGLVVLTQLLIWSGGDLTLLDGDRHSPVYYARVGMHQEILSVLVANGYVDDLSDASSNVDMAHPFAC